MRFVSTYEQRSNLIALFGSWNKFLKWNDYFIRIVILLFGRDLFLGIAIPWE
jgi:hypothetical protein